MIKIYELIQRTPLYEILFCVLDAGIIRKYEWYYSASAWNWIVGNIEIWNGWSISAQPMYNFLFDAVKEQIKLSVGECNQNFKKNETHYRKY